MQDDNIVTIDQLSEFLRLNSECANFTAADKQEQKDNAIREFSDLLKLVPQNQDIQKILNNLKAEKAAQDGLSGQFSVTQPSADEINIKKNSPAD